MKGKKIPTPERAASISLACISVGILIGLGIASLVIPPETSLPSQLLIGILIVLPCELLAGSVAPWFGGVSLWRD